MIQYQGVHKGFGSKKVLQGVDLDIQKGEVMVVLGGSGSGKSVLTSMLVGLLFPDKGQIRLGAKLLPAAGDATGWREVWTKVGYLFQGGALFDSMTVFANVAFPLRHNLSLSAAEVEQRVMRLLEILGVADARDKYPAEISGGMQKRVALARSIALEPEVIVYDEPTTGLDPLTTGTVGQLILDMKQRFAVTSVVVSHDIKLTRMIADNLAFLQDGRIIFHGPLEQLAQAPDVLQRFFAV